MKFFVFIIFLISTTTCNKQADEGLEEANNLEEEV